MTRRRLNLPSLRALIGRNQPRRQRLFTPLAPATREAYDRALARHWLYLKARGYEADYEAWSASVARADAADQPTESTESTEPMQGMDVLDPRSDR